MSATLIAPGAAVYHGTGAFNEVIVFTLIAPMPVLPSLRSRRFEADEA